MKGLMIMFTAALLLSAAPAQAQENIFHAIGATYDQAEGAGVYTELGLVGQAGAWGSRIAAGAIATEHGLGGANAYVGLTNAQELGPVRLQAMGAMSANHQPGLPHMGLMGDVTASVRVAEDLGLQAGYRYQVLGVPSFEWHGGQFRLGLELGGL